MASVKGSKFISKNRKPRVQIQYEMDPGNAQTMVELPFLVGVMSDLSGASAVAKKDITEREFIDFDAANLDNRMKAIKPAVKFQVDNHIPGAEEEQLDVNLTFESIDDFRPDKIAQQHPVLAKLYEQRRKLDNLLAMVDGKPEKAKLIMKALENDELMKAIAAEEPKDGE